MAENDRPFIYGLHRLVASGLGGDGWDIGTTDKFGVLLLDQDWIADGPPAGRNWAATSVAAVTGLAGNPYELTSTAYQLNGDGRVAGGDNSHLNGRFTLTSIDSNVDVTGGMIPMHASAVQWLSLSSGDAIGGALIFVSSSPNDALNIPLFFHGSTSATGVTGDYLINWNAASGVAYAASS